MLEKVPYGISRNGDAVEEFTLSSGHASARIITYGATITSIDVPDREGRTASVVLNRANLAEYETAGGHYGATIGRFANRIANGRFSLDGKSHQLSVNRAPNTLHGGFNGFDKKIWEVEAASDEDGAPALRLRYVSPDGEEGFPGTLDVRVIFTLQPPCSLQIDYEATTDAATVVNLTNHSYFNLRGDAREPVTVQSVEINADACTPVDENLIPTGAIVPVKGTRFDFRSARPIGDQAYDLNWVLNGKSSGEPRIAARALDDTSGRALEVLTTEPGLQFYSAPGLNGFALETQHFPDAPNHPEFPSTVLRPGERLWSRTVFRFSRFG